MNVMNENELNDLLKRWKMYIEDHNDCVYDLGDEHYLTYTEMAINPANPNGAIAFIYAKYGEWVLNIELQKTFVDFEDFFWDDVENRMTPIIDIVKKAIEGNENIYNPESFAYVVSDKIRKSIAYGGSWQQMRIYLGKQIAEKTERRYHDRY